MQHNHRVFVTDLLEKHLDVGVFGHVDDEMPIVVGDRLQVLSQHLYDRILDGIALLVLHDAFEHGLLPVHHLGEQYKQEQSEKQSFLQDAVLLLDNKDK